MISFISVVILTLANSLTLCLLLTKLHMSNPPFVILASCLVGSKLFVADFPSLSLRLAFESNPSHLEAIVVDLYSTSLDIMIQLYHPF